MINYFRIGKIIALHGIKGEVKIFATTDDIKRYDFLKEFYILKSEDACDIDFDNATIYEKISVKYVKNNPIIKIKGFDTIEDSNKLVGLNIYVKRSDAVKLLPNEFYIADVIGINVFVQNKLIGSVKEMLKTKANDIIVVDYNGKELLIPFIHDFIEKVDIDNKKIDVSTIEGLL